MGTFVYGQPVRVVYSRPLGRTALHYDCTVGWDEDMAKLDGRIGTISGVNRTYSTIKFGKWDSWAFLNEDIQPLTDNEPL